MQRAGLFLVAILTSVSAWGTEYYDIDPVHTYPHFAIDHLGVSTLYGRFDQTRGKLIIDRDNNNGFIDISISAVSINTGDIKRDDQLRSPDFLHVMEYPNIDYKSRRVRFVGEDQAKVEGDLTLLGVTKPVPLDVSRIRCKVNPVSKKYTCGFEANATIKRSDFGSTFGAPHVGDSMKLWFQVEAIREERL